MQKFGRISLKYQHTSMKTISSKQALAVLMVSAALLPLAKSQALFRSIDDEGRWSEQVADQRQRAISNAKMTRARKRAYSRALSVCRLKLSAGEEVDCPDINNLESYKQYLDAVVSEITIEDSVGLHGSAPDPTSITRQLTSTTSYPSALDSEYSVIDERTRDLLRFYTRLGHCPSEAWGRNLPVGFVALCSKVNKEALEKKPKIAAMRRTRHQYLSDLTLPVAHNPEKANFLKRIKNMMVEANTRNRRTDVKPLHGAGREDWIKNPANYE